MSRGGFTLPEVVVSLVLASLLALLVHRGVGEVVRLHERSAARREAAAEAAAIRRQVAAWLRGAFVAEDHPAGRFEGEDGGSSAESADRLRFRTLAPGSPGPLGVELALAGAERGEGAGLVARVAAGEGTAEVVPLVPGARGLQARYLLDLGDELRWVDRWSSGARLPRAVELRVQGEDVPPLLRVPLLVVLSGG